MKVVKEELLDNRMEESGIFLILGCVRESISRSDNCLEMLQYRIEDKKPTNWHNHISVFWRPY